MVFTQIWYLHKQGLQDQNKGITNCAEFTLQWRNYPIWRSQQRYFDEQKESIALFEFNWALGMQVSRVFFIHLRHYVANIVEYNYSSQITPFAEYF